LRSEVKFCFRTESPWGEVNQQGVVKCASTLRSSLSEACHPRLPSRSETEIPACRWRGAAAPSVLLSGERCFLACPSTSLAGGIEHGTHFISVVKKPRFLKHSISIYAYTYILLPSRLTKSVKIRVIRGSFCVLM
jgi:hypothetical protein